MPNAPTLPSDKRPRIRETPFDLKLYHDTAFLTFSDAVRNACKAAPHRGRQQVSRREDIRVAGRPLWVVQDVR